MHGIKLVDFSSALDHFTEEGSLGDFSPRLYPKKRFIMKRQRHDKGDIIGMTRATSTVYLGREE